MRGAGPKLKQRQWNSCRFPDQRKRANCLEFFPRELKKYASFKFAHVISFLQNVFQTLQTFHFKVAIWDIRF